MDILGGGRRTRPGSPRNTALRPTSWHPSLFPLKGRGSGFCPTQAKLGGDGDSVHLNWIEAPGLDTPSTPRQGRSS